MIKKSDKVLTFGSTVGIEAVYWGTPSILAGIAFYKDLGGTYNPESHEILIQLLTSELKPKNKQLALMYGYYYNTYGIQFKYYKPDSFLSGKFKNERLKITQYALIKIRIHKKMTKIERKMTRLKRKIIKLGKTICLNFSFLVTRK